MVLFFSLIFILKLDEPFRNEEIFMIFFFKSSDLGFWSKKHFFCSFWLIFSPLDPDRWIRKFLQIRIQEAKILRICWIRILSTVSITIRKKYQNKNKYRTILSGSRKTFLQTLVWIINFKFGESSVRRSTWESIKFNL